MTQDVICLIAPTASGKTALAYELYDTGRYHLISVDSALIYRDMNIGTAKPTAEELQQYPHALVDIIDPDQSYSVAQFVNDAKREIDFAHAQGKTPVLVGGTLMYYMALLEGMNDIPATDPTIRQQVMAMIEVEGIESLHQYLASVDPITASRLNPTDTQRVGRAVEVYKQTGRALSDWHAQPLTALADNPKQHWYILAVMPDRAWLHERIALRLEMMWQQGLIEEVVALTQKYRLHPDMPSMRCVGYRQVWDYLVNIQAENTNDGVIGSEIDKQATTFSLPIVYSNENIVARQAMENQALYATRQLAKRQYTWMRKLVSHPRLQQRHNLQQLPTVEQAKAYILQL